MTVKIDEKAIAAIKAALDRGNDAEVRRKGDGVVVMEIKKTTTYCAPAIGRE